MPSQKAKRSCALSLDPWRLTARTRGRSSHFGCATPITAASTISGWAIARFSSSIDDIHSPPDLMTSFVRNLHVTVAVDRGDITRERPAIGTLAFRHLVVSAQSRPPESRGRQLPCHRGGDFCCCILHRMGSLCPTIFASPASPRYIRASTVGHCGINECTRSTKARSKNTTTSSAWLTMYTICSTNSLGLIV